jgi:hypothetical protein
LILSALGLLSQEQLEYLNAYPNIQKYISLLKKNLIFSIKKKYFIKKMNPGNTKKKE